MTETDEIEKPEADIPRSQWNIVTTASEYEQSEEESLKNHEPSVTNDEQAIEPGGIITNIRPTKSLRLILGLISGINLAKINLLDLS